jgi:hypothetical protein
MNKTTQGKTARVRALQRWRFFRDELSERRQTRSEYRGLQRELASFSTQASIDDLLCTIEDQPGPDADMIRGILTNNMMQQRSHQLAS